MTSKDKDVVSWPVSPWDAILKAAKDQLPSLDSDSSLVSKSFFLDINCPAGARTALGIPLHRSLWSIGFILLINPWVYFWISTSFRILSGFARLLSMGIGVPYTVLQWSWPPGGLNTKVRVFALVALNSWVRSGPMPTSESNNLFRIPWYGPGGILLLEVVWGHWQYQWSFIQVIHWSETRHSGWHRTFRVKNKFWSKIADCARPEHLQR